MNVMTGVREYCNDSQREAFLTEKKGEEYPFSPNAEMTVLLVSYLSRFPR